MKIILDIREHDLYEKLCGGGVSGAAGGLVVPPEIKIEQKMLPLGDIIFTRGDDEPPYVLMIERKSISDLLASIKDGRYREQSYRLTNNAVTDLGGNPHNIIYLIEGIIQGQSPQLKKQIYGAITSLNYFKGFSVLRTSSIHETAEIILAMAVKIEKELNAGTVPAVLGGAAVPTNTETTIEEAGASGAGAATAAPPAPYASVVKKNKRENITEENIGAIMLSQIPGLSGTMATQIMQHFEGSIYNLIECVREDPDFLNDLKFSATENGPKKRISKTVIENIKKYLVHTITIK